MSTHHQQGLNVNLFHIVAGALRDSATPSTASEIEPLRSASTVRDRADE